MSRLEQAKCEVCRETATAQCQSCGTGMCEKHNYHDESLPYDHLCDVCIEAVKEE